MMRAEVKNYDNNSLVHTHTIEIPIKDTLKVNAAYEEYLEQLKIKKNYLSLTPQNQSKFNLAYNTERFENYEAFKRSPYGRNNLFAAPPADKNTKIMILKFETEEDANQFLETLKRNGIKYSTIPEAKRSGPKPSSSMRS